MIRQLFSSPGETASQTPKAIVVPKPGRTITEEEILEYAAQHLPSYKKPRKIVIVGSVPRFETGKIDRKAIRKLYEEV
jgi:acyl-CoA synthetase (AMP-forming)/AMP-acid ligase II